jgi:hypothetical protein
MTTCAEWQTKLDAADAALEKLTLGGQVVLIRDGENEVRYSSAKRGDLQAWRDFLQGQVDICNGVYRNRRRAFGVIPLG